MDICDEPTVLMQRCCDCYELFLPTGDLGERCAGCQEVVDDEAAHTCQICDTGQSTLWHWCAYEQGYRGVDPELKAARRELHIEHEWPEYAGTCLSCGAEGITYASMCEPCCIKEGNAQRQVREAWSCGDCRGRNYQHKPGCPEGPAWGGEDIPF